MTIINIYAVEEDFKVLKECIGDLVKRFPNDLIKLWEVRNE